MSPYLLLTHLQQGKRLPLEEQGEKLGKGGRMNCKLLQVNPHFPCRNAYTGDLDISLRYRDTGLQAQY